MKKIVVWVLFASIVWVSFASPVVVMKKVTDPIACPANYEPICGVDGQTYGNTCSANVAKVAVDYQGQCTEKVGFWASVGQWFSGVWDSLVGLFSSNETPTTVAVDTPQAQLDNAKAKWTQQRLSNYVMTQQKWCFCPREYTRPMQYTVKNGAVDMTAIVYDDTKEKVTIKVTPMTVDEAFAMIQKAITNKVDKLTVSYDEKMGYPKKVFIDQSIQMADEERSYTFSVVAEHTMKSVWKLSMFDGKDVSAQNATVELKNGKLHGNFCNVVNGSYTQEKDTITFGPMMMTMMACEGEIMAIETAFGGLKKATYSVSDDKKKMTIAGDGHTFVFVQ